MDFGQMEKSKFFDTDSIVPFGKWKGHSIEEIYELDCQYLIWMYENFDDTEWSDDAELLITRAYDDDLGQYQDELLNRYLSKIDLGVDYGQDDY